jgi:SHS2 domain-containing protein
MPRHPLPHPADTGIEATAPSFPGLLTELAAGMFELMALPGLPPEDWVQFRVEESTLPDLVVETLSRLLYEAEVRGVIFSRFAVDHDPASPSFTIRAGGARSEAVELVGPPIKAVTYHDLAIEERAGGWYGRVYFDV